MGQWTLSEWSDSGKIKKNFEINIKRCFNDGCSVNTCNSSKGGPNPGFGTRGVQFRRW